MPGLVDGHCHPTKGATVNLFSCKFEFTATPDEIARTLIDYAVLYPTIECIIGGRWGSDFFNKYNIPSPRNWLDQYVSDRAVYLRDDSGHNGWANSNALQLVGVDRNSKDPAGGKVMRDPETREPTGLLLEEAHTSARSRLPDWDAAQYQAGTLKMLTNGIVVSINEIYITGLGGIILKSVDGGKRFTTLEQGHRNGFMAIIQGPTGDLITVGEKGIGLLH